VPLDGSPADGAARMAGGPESAVQPAGFDVGPVARRSPGRPAGPPAAAAAGAPEPAARPQGRMNLALAQIGLDAEDRAALGLWLVAHLALLVLAWAAAWSFRISLAHAPLTGGF